MLIRSSRCLLSHARTRSSLEYSPPGRDIGPPCSTSSHSDLTSQSVLALHAAGTGRLEVVPGEMSLTSTRQLTALGPIGHLPEWPCVLRPGTADRVERRLDERD